MILAGVVFNDIVYRVSNVSNICCFYNRFVECKNIIFKNFNRWVLLNKFKHINKFFVSNTTPNSKKYRNYGHNLLVYIRTRIFMGNFFAFSLTFGRDGIFYSEKAHEWGDLYPCLHCNFASTGGASGKSKRFSAVSTFGASSEDHIRGADIISSTTASSGLSTQKFKMANAGNGVCSCKLSSLSIAA